MNSFRDLIAKRANSKGVIVNELYPAAQSEKPGPGPIDVNQNPVNGQNVEQEEQKNNKDSVKKK